MVEIAFDTFVSYSFPTFCSSFVQAIEELGAEMNPPYSHGSYFIEIRGQFLTYSWVHRAFFNDMCEPLFTLVARQDYVYIDANFAKFSTRRVDDTYRTFSENLAIKWPGYMLAKSGHIMNSTDRLVSMDSLLNLLRSKNIDRYEADKDLFFGPQARYTTGNSQE